MKTLITLAALATLTGCATHAIHFAPVQEARAERPVTVMNAMIIGVEEVARPTASNDVSIDALPAEDDEALRSPVVAHAYASSFTLPEHVPMAFSFHCVSGDESLGCNAKPADTYIERDFDAILATSK